MEKGVRKTVLIVEDEATVRVIVAKMLETLGYDVLQAEGTGEALELSRAHSGDIHLLLTDVLMPGETGVVLAHKLLAKRPETKVLYMSGYDPKTSFPNESLDGNEHFLAKPFNLDQLALKLREVLHRA